ncbi:MAG: chromate transporter, partial [Chloroflexota bacterium]
VLERKLVSSRKAIAKEEFLTYYALARVVPTGTQTALAVSLGRHFAGIGGSIVAMAGLLTPVFVTTVALTVGFTYLHAASAAEILPRTVLPAALALIAVGAISMGRSIVGIKRESALALAAFLTAWFLRLPPGLVLLMGGFVGMVIFRQERKATKGR